MVNPTNSKAPPPAFRRGQVCTTVERVYQCQPGERVIIADIKRSRGDYWYLIKRRGFAAWCHGRAIQPTRPNSSGQEDQQQQQPQEN